MPTSSVGFADSSPSRGSALVEDYKQPDGVCRPVAYLFCAALAIRYAACASAEVPLWSKCGAPQTS